MHAVIPIRGFYHRARVEAIGGIMLLEAPTIMWVKLGATPTAPTSNG
jgi:hypothetical protein